MTEQLVIIGAGGFGREVVDIVDAINSSDACEPRVPRFEVLGFLDDGTPDPATLAPYGVGHLGPVSQLAEMPANVGIALGIGSPHVRRQLVESYPNRSCPVFVHPSATMGRAVTLGEGSIVCAGVRLTNNITIGRHVHLNLNVTVGHDARLEDFVTVSPLVAISGYVHVEREVMIGTGVTLNPGITIGSRAVVGSGAAALKSVPSGATAVGVPAKPR